MEHQKLSKLINDSTVSKFVTKKLIQVNNVPNGQYSANKKKRIRTPMVRSDL